MKVSIITAVYNGAKHIRSCITSVLSQDYPDIEYIVVDGNSKDNTLEIVQSFGDKVAKVISEPDKGMYDAMNKGIALATGDIIGILNSDDFYLNTTIISQVVREFEKTGADTLYGDIAFVEEENTEKLVRYYDSGTFRTWKFRFGYTPAHPALFVRKSIYEKWGGFDISYKICGDFELMCRYYYKLGLSFAYLPKTLVKMRLGGMSNVSWKNRLRLNAEQARACRQNGMWSHDAVIFLKYFTKIFQFVGKKSLKE